MEKPDIHHPLDVSRRRTNIGLFYTSQCDIVLLDLKSRQRRARDYLCSKQNARVQRRGLTTFGALALYCVCMAILLHVSGLLV